MPNEFYIMSLMALLNAVHTYGITVCGVTGMTSEEKYITLRMNQKLMSWEKWLGGGENST